MPKDREFRTVRGYRLVKQSNERNLTPSMEDYLEMIYRIWQRLLVVRVTTLAEQLNVQAPSVSRIVRRLADKGYVHYQKYGVIELTSQDKQLSKCLLQRHETIEQFLLTLGATDSLLVDTELIEHYLSPNTITAMTIWNAFLQDNADVLERFDEFRREYSANLGDVVLE